jgi:DNA-binding response OmpR family regulator
MSHRILLVENDDRLCALLDPALAEAGHWVVRARSGLEALSRLTPKAPPVDLVVTEVDLGGGPDGWQVSRRARLRWPGLPVIYLTRAPSDERLPEHVPLGALLPRPFPLNQLVEMARHLVLARAEARLGRSWT